ncbi:MAG TPA: hypothetical protein VMS95_01260 [Candidatus Krumholzibacteriaceae bacterium]|nr:hypothetical protein [Candidatus Krumholzibacteriaceae bacterium]
MYELDDQQHLNETFTENVSVPNEAFINDKITIKTTIRYSSHVAGGIPPNYPVRLLHYTEYYEGKLTTNNNSRNLNDLQLIIITAAIATAIVGGTIFATLRRNKHTPPSPQDREPWTFSSAKTRLTVLSPNPHPPTVFPRKCDVHN